MSVKVPPISTPTLNLVIQQYPRYRPSSPHRYRDGPSTPRLRGDGWREGRVIPLFGGHRDDGGSQLIIGSCGQLRAWRNFSRTARVAASSTESGLPASTTP